MANIIVSMYEWLNAYFVNFSGYLVTVIIVVAFIFWGDEMFAALERAYAKVVRLRVRRSAPRALAKAPHLDSFIIFLVGALVIIPALQSIAQYLLQPLLRTTSLLVILVIVFMFFYIYYVHVFRHKILQ